ncbi:hypothetical protein AB0M39_39720 [Streptomyces sp. NPDC051907]|uniref:hypothetical protein n=1 Tax=Streptomyces sp. NPDC051907 TaxID=3155284 RepID=UPI0034339784
MPKFIFIPADPRNPDRFTVYLQNAAPSSGRGELLGVVWQSAAAGWTADFAPEKQGIGVPGFITRQAAAECLYWYAPPVQSARSRPAGQASPGAAVDTGIDASVCTCCVNNHCECEGTLRSSARSGAEISAASHPSLIPVPGVLFSLTNMPDGYLVDMNTRGAGSGIGYLRQLDDGAYSVRLGRIEVGRATTPEAGLWTVIQLHTGSKRYARLLEGYEPTREGALGDIRVEP